MPRDKDPELRARLLRETDAAIEVQKLGGVLTWWIPRSQIGYMRKDKTDTGTNVVFTLPEWLVEKKQCWELVP